MNNSQMQKINKGKRLSPLRAIKSYCKLMCCANDRASWQNCTFTSCFLYNYRLGKGNRARTQEHNKKPMVLPLSSDKLEPSGDRQEKLE